MVAEAFWRQVDRQPDHWYWRGCTLPNGYGQWRHAGGHILAHRFAAVALGLVTLAELPHHRIQSTCPHKLCVLHVQATPYRLTRRRLPVERPPPWRAPAALAARPRAARRAAAQARGHPRPP